MAYTALVRFFIKITETARYEWCNKRRCARRWAAIDTDLCVIFFFIYYYYYCGIIHLLFINWYIYVFASIIRGLLSRVQIVSQFMKDAQLGLKRLASMPDRTTNTISTEEGLPMCPLVRVCERCGWTTYEDFDFNIRTHAPIHSYPCTCTSVCFL